MNNFKQKLNKSLNNMLKIYILSVFFIQLILSQESLSEFRQHSEAICMEPDVKNFPLITIGWVTPTSIDGFEVALKYASKFDIVSPTYFEIKPEILNEEFNVIV